MNYRKRGLKALGLSMLAVLGLMAFGTSGAGASGKVLVTGLTAPFTVGLAGEGENMLENSFLILGLNMEIFCHIARVTGGLLSSSGHGSATYILENCLAQGSSGGALTGAVCTIHNIEAKVLILVILHSGNSTLTTAQHGTGTGSPYLLITPLDGLTFTKVLNHTECALPEIANVKGSVVAAVTTSGDQQTHLITTKGMLSLFGGGNKLSYGVNETHLDADALIKLNNSVHGNHSGLTWGVE